MPIRTFLAEKRHATMAAGLMRRFQLHIDQTGVIEREIMLLLMGIEGPEEFAQALKDDAELPDDVLSAVISTINQELLMPLREELRQGGAATMSSNKPTQGVSTHEAQGQQTRSSTPQQAQGERRMPMPAPKPAPSTMLKPPTLLVQQPTSAPLPPKAVMPRQNGILPPTAQPPMLPLGEEGPIIPNQRINLISRPQAPQPPTPQRTPAPLAPAHPTPQAPVHLPGTTIPVPTAKPTPPAPPIPPTSPAKPYSVDPYREPLE
jgi:hypothetical protein